MVKKRDKGIRKSYASKGLKEEAPRASKINAPTAYGTSSEWVKRIWRASGIERVSGLGEVRGGF